MGVTGRKIPVTLTLGAFAAVTSLTGCSGLDSGSDSSGNYKLIAATQPTDVIMTAEISGQLVLINETCIGISTDLGNLTAIFPHGTSLREINLGSQIAGSGGYFDWQTAADLAQVEIPTECRTAEVAYLSVG